MSGRGADGDADAGRGGEDTTSARNAGFDAVEEKLQTDLAHPRALPAAVKEYEHEMFERTSAAARRSADMKAMLMAPDAADRLLAFFQPG